MVPDAGISMLSFSLSPITEKGQNISNKDTLEQNGFKKIGV